MIVEIKNWDKYNPRKDLKTLTWLRLESDIGFSESLFGLDAEAKWLWIFLLSFSAKKNKSTFLVDVEYFAFHSGVKKERIEKYLIAFSDKDLIEIKTDSSHVRTDTIESVSYETNGTNDTERNETNEADTVEVEPPTISEGSNISTDKILLLFNTKLGGVGKIKHSPYFIPSALLEDYKILIGFPEFQKLETWENYFNLVATSSFLTNDFTPTLAWLFKSENAYKVLAGQYQDREAKIKPPDKTSETLVIAASAWARYAYRQFRDYDDWFGDSDLDIEILSRIGDLSGFRNCDEKSQSDHTAKLKNAYIENHLKSQRQTG